MKMRRLCFVLAPAMALALGCDNSSTSAPPTPSAGTAAPQASTPPVAPAASSMASARPHDRGRDFAPGTAGMMLRSAQDLTLSDDQKTKIAGLEGQLRPDPAAMNEMKAMNADIAAGVRAGKIDAAKVKSHYAALDQQQTARQAKEADALNGLYAALDAGQRKQLVDAVRAKQASKDDRKPPPTAAASASAGGDKDWAKHRLDRMTKQLGLDDAQKTQVAALLAKQPAPPAMQGGRDAMKTKIDALLNAFASDSFDAKKLDLSMMPANMAHDMTDKEIAFLGQLLPILKSDQREKLATTYERPPMMMGGRGRPHGDGVDDDDDGDHPSPP